MQDSGIPAKFPIPFANNAGAGFIRAIPQASQVGVQNGAASLFDGFPPNCFIPIASGGSWPFAQDFNGILNQTTRWCQWLQAGGPLFYDAAFSTAIGGYPKGAVLNSSVTNALQWVSTVDNNTTNPDSGGTNWTTISSVPFTWSAQQTFATAPVLNNNVSLLAKDNAGVTHNLIFYNTTNTVLMTGGQGGFVVNNNANTANNLILDDATGNATVRGTVTTTAVKSPVGGVLSGNLPSPGMAAGAAVANIGYFPVQQGTGIGQTTNVVKIGYNGSGKIKITIDASDFGNIATEDWVNGLNKPIAATASSGGGFSSTATATVSFTPPGPGYLLITSSRNYNTLAATNGGAVTYFNGAPVCTDNTLTSVSHSYAVFTAGGSVVTALIQSVSDTTTSQTVFISMLYVPYI